MESLAIWKLSLCSIPLFKINNFLSSTSIVKYATIVTRYRFLIPIIFSLVIIIKTMLMTSESNNNQFQIGNLSTIISTKEFPKISCFSSRNLLVSALNLQLVFIKMNVV